mgnify:CR=1 FL=1
MKKLKVIINKNSNIVYNQDEYDNWAYDGKAIIIEKDSKIVAIYSIDNIICAIGVEED